jgi:uncharacterized protein
VTERTGRFFVVALGLTWLLQLPAVLAQWGVIAVDPGQLMPLTGLGTLTPIAAAVWFSWREPGGLRALRDQLKWRVGAGWYLVAVFGLMLVYVAAVGVYFVFGGREAGWLYLPAKEHVPALFLIPIVEEVGWRGYALPRLQRQHGPVKATLLLGPAWALWHLMMFLLNSTTPAVFLVEMLYILVGSFVFTWVYNRTGGSLLMAILLHFGAHLNNPSHALPNATPMLIYTCAIIVVVAALLRFDRAAWDRRTVRSPHT